jgi:hypothetical protein
MRQLLLVLAACGGGSAAPALDASGDGGAGEICNGVDDTQDGVVDEGCPCTPFDVSVPGTIYSPDIVWTGERYFVVTGDVNTIEVAPVTDGMVGPSFLVGVAPTTYSRHDLAWSGTTLAVVLQTASLASELALFEPDGTEISRQTLPSTPFWLRAMWAGDRFVLTGQSTNNSNTLVFAEYSATGALLFGPMEIPGMYNISYVGPLAISPSHYLVGVATTARGSAFLIDRATHTGVHRELDFASQFAQVSTAYAGGTFVVTASGGGGSTFSGGDSLRFFDDAGAAVSFNAMPYTSYASTLTAEGGVFTGVALLEDTSTERQYTALQIDSIGDPLAKPILPLATVSATGGYTGLDSTSPASRFAFTHGSQNSVRVLQHCW